MMNLFGIYSFVLFVACLDVRAFHLPVHPSQQTMMLPSIDLRKPQDVPGDSPVTYCDESNPENDLFQVTSLDAHPNPLRRSVRNENMISLC